MPDDKSNPFYLPLQQGPAYMGPHALESLTGPSLKEETGEPTIWDNFVSATEHMPLVNTITPYGFSPGMPIGTSTGLRGYKEIKSGAIEIKAARELNPGHPIYPIEEGLARMASGGFQAATPLMIAGGVAEPVATARMLGGAYLGSKVVENLPQGWMQPETRQLMSVLGSVVGGGMAGGPGMIRELRSRVRESVENDLRASRQYGTKIDEGLVRSTVDQLLEKADAQANSVQDIARRAGQRLAVAGAQGAGQVFGRGPTEEPHRDIRDMYEGKGMPEAKPTPEQLEQGRQAWLKLGKGKEPLGPSIYYNAKTGEPEGFNYERLTTAPEVPQNAKVGTSARPITDTKSATESIPTAPSPQRPGEPVSTSEGSKITGPGLEPRSTRGVEELPGLQKLEGSLRVTDPSAMETIQRDMERRGLTPPASGANQGRRAGDINVPIKDSEGERGSLSFKPLNPQQRAAYQSPFRNLADLIDKVLPDKPETEQAARTIIRDSASRLALKTLQMETKMKDLITSHDNDGKTEFQAFMDAGEGKPGAQFLSPQDQAAADFFHQNFEARWEKIQQIRQTGGGGIENYLSHLWEKRGTAGDMLTKVLYSKRPLEGRAGFLKGRVYDYASEGLAAGLKPVTYNPIRMQLAAMFQIDKFIMAHDVKDMYVGQGLAKWFKFGEDMSNKPQSWQAFDDKIFRPSVYDKGALKSYGTYYGPPEVAKVFNRYLAPGLRGNMVYDKARSFGNVLNQAQLTLSAYHATFESIVAMASDVGLGMQKISRGDFLGGTSDTLRGLTFRSPGFYYGLGKRIQAEALEPTGNPALGRYVNAITEAGGRFKQENTYITQKTGSLMSTIKRGKIFEAASTGLQNIPILKHIMQSYVPRIKLGMAARMIDAKLDWLDKNGISDPMTVANEMGKIWDSVDNRAGQLVYDNLFWNKVAKDTAFLAVRSVGWNYGTFREGLGALKDTAKQGAQVLRGKRPEITDRMAFTAGLTTTAALIGSGMHYIATGQIPRNATDMFFPSTGVLGPNGKEQRDSIPSYVKDVVAFAQHPVDTVLHKIHPLISTIAETWQDSDFYGTEIYNPADSRLTKVGKTGLFAAKQLEPLGVTAMQHQIQQGVSPVKAALSLAGIMPAPTYIGQTKAEELAFDLAKRNWQAGPRTAGDEIHRDTFKQFQTQMQEGKLKSEDIASSVKAGKFQIHDINRLFEERGLSQFQREFKGLDLKEGLAVMKEADPNEKVQLRGLLIKKIHEIGTGRYGEEEDRQMLKEVKELVQ